MHLVTPTVADGNFTTFAHAFAIAAGDCRDTLMAELLRALRQIFISRT